MKRSDRVMPEAVYQMAVKMREALEAEGLYQPGQAKAEKWTPDETDTAMDRLLISLGFPEGQVLATYESVAAMEACCSYLFGFAPKAEGLRAFVALMDVQHTELELLAEVMEAAGREPERVTSAHGRRRSVH